MKYYRVRDWGKHFENNRTREMVKMSWVPVPNKHDGEGFQRIMHEPDGMVIYGCWHLILQVASKLRDRGTLLRDDGTPVTAECLAIKTGWNRPEDFTRSLEFCSSPDVAWLEVLTTEQDGIPHPPAEIPHPPARNGMELNGMEEKRREENATRQARRRENQKNADAVDGVTRNGPVTHSHISPATDYVKILLESDNPSLTQIVKAIQTCRPDIPHVADYAITNRLQGWARDDARIKAVKSFVLDLQTATVLPKSITGMLNAYLSNAEKYEGAK